MRHKGKLLASVAVAVSAISLAAVPAAGAHADTITPLPITSFYQIVADSAHNHLFLSEGSGADAILVTDLMGNKVTTIAGENGAEGMALSPDGSTLYVALAGADAVSAISTTTLKETAQYPLGPGDTPQGVVVQSGALWVSYADNTGLGAIGEISLTAATPAFAPQAVPGTWQAGAPQLAADPNGGGALVGAKSEKGSTATWVASYNVSTNPVTVHAQPTTFINCENEGDLAVAPGGKEFILACAWPYTHYRYSTANLSQLGDYPSSAYPNAVAIAGTGTVAAGISDGAYSGVPDIHVYAPDASTPLNSYAITDYTDSLAARGLAWSANGSELFAVLQTPNQITGTSTYSLRVLYPPLNSSTLTLSGASTAPLGTTVSPMGMLRLGGNNAPAGIPVTITRTLAGSSGTEVFTVKTAADGSFTPADKPAAPGTYTYAAMYSGSTTAGPATASYTVTITRIPAALSVTTGPGTVNYASAVTVTAHLGATYTRPTVSIYAQTIGSKSRTLIATGAVDSHGNLTVRYLATDSTTFSAVFSGDAYYTPESVTRTVYVRAGVFFGIGGYYASKRVGSVTYRLYHHTAHLDAAAIVAPDKRGECVKLEAQEYYRGSWHANITGCAILNKASEVGGYLTLNHADWNYFYRIRADYLRSNKDTSNLSADSGWQYFMVEK